MDVVVEGWFSLSRETTRKEVVAVEVTQLGTEGASRQSIRFEER
jgi:hypothetical protein